MKSYIPSFTQFLKENQSSSHSGFSQFLTEELLLEKNIAKELRDKYAGQKPFVDFILSKVYQVDNVEGLKEEDDKNEIAFWLANNLKTLFFTEYSTELQGLRDNEKFKKIFGEIKPNLEDNYGSKIISILNLYYSKAIKLKTLVGYSLNNAFKISDSWHKGLGTVFLEEREDEKNGKIIIEFEDGFYWIDLNTEYSEEERENMGHCGKDAGRVLYSLRNELKQSFVTASVDKEAKALYQCKGRNIGGKPAKPAKEFHPHIVKLLESDYIESKAPGSYMPELDFQIADLSETEFDRLLKLKPKLEDLGYIFVSIRTGDIEAVKNYIDRTLNINLQDGSKMSILSYAVGKRNKEIVELLIKEGADVNLKGTYQKTALILAVEKGYEEMVELLIKANGIDLNIRDISKKTALMYAVENDNSEIAELLIKANGIDLNIRDISKKTALMLAVEEEGNREIAELLIKADGIDLNVQDENKMTALMLAVEEDNREIVKLLIKANGIDLNVQDENKMTALVHAKKYGYTKIVELLKNAGAKE